METKTEQVKETATASNSGSAYPRAVQIWLIVGLIMVLGQIVIGGITRLTGSGLSSTEWEVVEGTLPPLNATQWEEAFDLYKATPQYAKINAGMSMSEFKFIYFWEYFHRLWARTMGFAFVIPFFIFWRRKWIDKALMRRLGIVVLLAALTASFGWIMVASGLIERPWVNTYKLTMHLSIACITFGYLLWTTFVVINPQKVNFPHKLWKTGALLITVVTIVQIMLGGMMAGAKAALFYPTWPDMNGVMLPEVLSTTANWSVENFVNYDANPFFPAFVQFFHRGTAYLLTIIILYFGWRWLKEAPNPTFKKSTIVLISLLVLQVFLGILTVINSKGMVPVDLGVYHQGVGILLLSAILFIDYQLFAHRN